jgi:hypothetical protein
LALRCGTPGFRTLTARGSARPPLSTPDCPPRSTRANCAKKCLGLLGCGTLLLISGVGERAADNFSRTSVCARDQVTRRRRAPRGTMNTAVCESVCVVCNTRFYCSRTYEGQTPKCSSCIRPTPAALEDPKCSNCGTRLGLHLGRYAQTSYLGGVPFGFQKCRSCGHTTTWGAHV